MVDVRANDADPDGEVETVDYVSQPAHGSADVSDDGQAVIDAPAPGYCGPDSFAYGLAGGSEGTVSLSVACVDDPPTAVGERVDVLQNSKPIALDVLANDTDSDGGPKRITSTIQPGDGAVRVIGGGSGLTFAPAPAFCGLTSFSYSLNGGSSAAVWIRVSCRRQVRLAPGRLYAGPRTLTARVLCPTMFDSCRGVKVRVVAAPRRGPGKGVLVASGKAGRITGGSRTGVRLTMTQRGYGLLRDRNGLLRVLAITRSPQTGAVRQLRFADDPNLASDGRSPTAS